QRGDQFSHPAENGAKLSARVGSRLPKCSQDAAVLGFRIDEAREERSDRECLDVAGVNPAEKWFRDRVDRFFAESSPEECSDRLVSICSPTRDESLARESRSATHRQQIVVKEAIPRCRNSQHRGGGQRVEAPTAQDERSAWRVRGDQPRSETERVAQLDRR